MEKNVATVLVQMHKIMMAENVKRLGPGTAGVSQPDGQSLKFEILSE